MITISNPEQYVVGILTRLSNERLEDLKRYGESGSISNQKELLNRFCRENKLRVYKTYVDDGESGAFYDRPGFVEMINDIDAGHINMVVVKDLSRFGRVAAGIDDYIEEYFQIKGIRFIAVNENLDSKTSANFQDDVKIRAFFNEWFLRDCSKKTRDGKHSKAVDGMVMATYPKYRIHERSCKQKSLYTK
jgi:site-specific DNA recombinase